MLRTDLPLLNELLLVGNNVDYSSTIVLGRYRFHQSGRLPFFKSNSSMYLRSTEQLCSLKHTEKKETGQRNCTLSIGSVWPGLCTNMHTHIYMGFFSLYIFLCVYIYIYVSLEECPFTQSELWIGFPRWYTLELFYWVQTSWEAAFISFKWNQQVVSLFLQAHESEWAKRTIC